MYKPTSVVSNMSRISIRVIDALCMALVCFRLHSPYSYPESTSVFQHSRKASYPCCFTHSAQSVLLVVSRDICCQLALGVSLRQGL